jgi:predicted GNAT family N-acyltransferase
VPPALRETLAGYEAGEAMCALQTGSWDELGEGASALRRAVFIEEQSIPAELEWDAEDASAVHGVARNRLGQVVATGRLLRDAAHPGTARIGRMAVHRVLRGEGWGERVLKMLEDAARARGDAEVRLHAQRSAERFYARLGYQPCGEPFVEAGIPHVEMRRSLEKD